MLQIKCEYFFFFFTDILPSANFTGRHIRKGCFFERLLFIWFAITEHSATDTISTNLFFVLGMTPNSANVISKHGERLEEILWQSEDLRNSRKLRKLVAI